jgi:hypothetical protein
LEDSWEDWRRRRAEEQGLVDNGRGNHAPHSARGDTAGRHCPPQIPASGVNQDAATGAEHHRTARPSPPSVAATVPVRPDHRRHLRLWVATAIAASLLLSGLFGWWLRSFISPIPVIIAVHAPTLTTVPPPLLQSPRPDISPPMTNRSSTSADAPSAVTKPIVNSEAATAVAVHQAAPAAAKPANNAVAKPAKSPAPRSAPRRKPSFYCRGTQSSVIGMICRNPALSALDIRMSSAYRRAVSGASLDHERVIDTDQTIFLNQRASCTTEACIAGIYRMRIKELERTVHSGG